MFVVKFLRKDPLWISINRGFIPTESNVLNVYFDETQDNALIGVNNNNENIILINRGYIENEY